jgi:hypothetical protein
MYWYNKNNDIINAYKEIIEDFQNEYYDPDPEENDKRPEIYLEDVFRGARLREGTKSFFEKDEGDKIFEEKDYESFIKYMKSVNYDAGYGTQNFFGFILLKDNTWFVRYSYDGKECWVHKKTPTLSKSI